MIMIMIILAHQHKASRQKILQWKQSDHSDDIFLFGGEGAEEGDCIPTLQSH